MKKSVEGEQKWVRGTKNLKHITANLIQAQRHMMNSYSLILVKANELSHESPGGPASWGVSVLRFCLANASIMAS